MPFMPTDKPPYLAFAAHCAKPTKGMSLAERRAYFKERERLENIYLASMPRWKREVSLFAVPVLISIITGAVLLYFFFPFGLYGPPPK